jgi:MFS superfamily sulfate permease-like transporter
VAANRCGVLSVSLSLSSQLAGQHPQRPAGRSGGGAGADPEAIAFSIIAGVDPKVGLYASFCIAVVTPSSAAGRA